jgi:hypothetical protein
VGQNLDVAINAAELKDGHVVLGINVARGGVDSVQEVEEAQLGDIREIGAATCNGCTR